MPASQYAGIAVLRPVHTAVLVLLHFTQAQVLRMVKKISNERDEAAHPGRHHYSCTYVTGPYYANIPIIHHDTFHTTSGLRAIYDTLYLLVTNVIFARGQSTLVTTGIYLSAGWCVRSTYPYTPRALVVSLDIAATSPPTAKQKLQQY